MNNLLSAKKLGEILELSKRQIHRLNASGKIPAPIRIGGSIRWIVEEILLWIKSGCPDRDLWEQMKIQAEGDYDGSTR